MISVIAEFRVAARNRKRNMNRTAVAVLTVPEVFPEDIEAVYPHLPFNCASSI